LELGNTCSEDLGWSVSNRKETECLNCRISSFYNQAVAVGCYSLLWFGDGKEGDRKHKKWLR